jgi:hypothetical protein
MHHVTDILLELLKKGRGAMVRVGAGTPHEVCYLITWGKSVNPLGPYVVPGCGVLKVIRLWCPFAIQAVATVGPHIWSKGATEIENLIEPLVVSKDEEEKDSHPCEGLESLHIPQVNVNPSAQATSLRTQGAVCIRDICRI